MDELKEGGCREGMARDSSLAGGLADDGKRSDALDVLMLFRRKMD